jgi:hypothetical protein
MADLTTTPLRNVWRFQDAWELELAARCCRAWVPFEDALLVPEKVALADTIIKVWGTFACSACCSSRMLLQRIPVPLQPPSCLRACCSALKVSH